MTNLPSATAGQRPGPRAHRDPGLPEMMHRHPGGDAPPLNRIARWQLPLFLAMAYGLSWWPSFGRLANPDAAPMVPIGPTIAALIITGWVYGRPARRALLRSTINARIGRWWWAAAVPLAVAAAAGALTVLLGAAAPSGSEIGAAAATALATLPIILVLNGPLGEELGWRGYVLPLFLRRHSPITATLMLIPFWIAFHLPLIVTSPDQFGILWALTVVGMAFTMTWLHLGSGGSVLLAIVFHAVVNTSMPAVIQLFSQEDRLLAIRLAVVLWLLTAAAITIGPLRRAGRLGSTDRQHATPALVTAIDEGR